MLPNDFPRTAPEFATRFASEEACATYLEGLRWPEGFRCPDCDGDRAWRLTSRRVYECARCHRQTSLTAGTPLHGTRKPLRDWLWAIFLVATSKTGTSAKNLQRLLGHKSYETAWSWLHKIRAALVRPAPEPLRGRVEVDEAFVGGVDEGCRGRGGDKAIVAVAVEDRGGHAGRVRFAVVPDTKAQTLTPFVVDNVVAGSVLSTDGGAEFVELPRRGYLREAVCMWRSKRKSDELPLVHRVISLLKRWLLGTFQGAVSVKHLARYLLEFTFRFNRRNCATPIGIFHRLARSVVLGPRVTYDWLVAPEWSG